MAEFTIQLRHVLEHTGGYMGLDQYPIFDEAHREILNQKIIDRYWLQEIGQETIEIFCHFMARRMNEIMPYFNQLYETQKLEFDPITNTRMTTESQSEGTSSGLGTAENTNTQDSKSRAVNSDTPQVQLSGYGDYATSLGDAISHASADGMATNTTSDTVNNAGSSTVEGYQGSPSDLLTAFRSTIINIDLMVIEALADLFMLIWSTDGRNFVGEY